MQLPHPSKTYSNRYALKHLVPGIQAKNQQKKHIYPTKIVAMMCFAHLRKISSLPFLLFYRT